MGITGYFQIFLCLVCLGYCSGTVASDHKCNRKCEVDKSMTCEYHLTIENYYVLSKACYSCPFNQTDCFRPDCVITNGLKRNFMAINRQLPGPSIEVCKGDTVVVMVENKMEDAMSTSVHFHGLNQKYTCHMDGVAMLTQCGIQPYEVFRHEFIADPAGTHWYHSHSGLQMGEGLIGAFIVREPDASDPNSDLYDEDSSDHVLVISDWTDINLVEIYESEMHDRYLAVLPISGLVNGQGERHPQKDENNVTAYTPPEVFNVKHGKSYRFRMIGATTTCQFQVSVDNHSLAVIATDGKPLKPVTVQSIVIYPGERYDFVLTADQKEGNYWIKLQGLAECQVNKGHGYAILHYNGFEGDLRPDSDPTDFSTQDGVVLNPAQTGPVRMGDILQNELRHGGDAENYEKEKVDVQYFIGLTFLQNDNTRYNNPKYYNVHSLPGGRVHLTPTLNNITLLRPPVPLVTQWNDAKGTNFCNSHTMDTASDCNDDLCYCTHMLDVKLGQVVELFMVGYSGPHPMHLHGQDFRVVGDGLLGEEFNAMSIDDIKMNDEAGKFPRILKNPMHKDTVNVGQGKYTIIRFKATNPGIWFFHCHNEGHLMQGMALLVKVGDPNEFPTPPSWFAKCGGYMYQQKNAQYSAAPEPTDSSSFPVVYVLVGAGVLILMLLLTIVILAKKLLSHRAGYTRVPS